MKQFLQSFIKRKQKEVKKNTVISSLAPKVLTKKEDIEKIQPYLDKLNETIDTKGINNIALTGGYGSGKSTIIGTFKELNPQYEFLNISLASFNKKKSDEKLTASERKLQKEELERLLEVSILQQIFYHVKPEEIPESRFKRIINIPNWKIWSISIGFILWISSSVLLLKYNYLDKINPSSWSTKYSFDWFALFVFIIAFIGLGLFSKLIIKLFSNSKINKVNIKGELELGDNVNKSVFNEHLEEILYFFERTNYDVVLIEDLDRFDSTDIFTKLREINILLNNSKLINREINFVYAVGDDLFEDKKERVKFFEYIIPVIPFINSSNADEQLRTLIKEARLDENIFTKEFISDVTTFIDDIDMRLLTNIFHEFVIYRKTLKPEFIKKNDELFAMITYKNIDPKDFTQLNKKEGKLYRLINDKGNYIKKFMSKIDAKITLKNSQIKDIEQHTITDIKELNSIYFQQIFSKLPHNALIDKVVIESDFNDLVERQSLNYNYHQRGYGNLSENTFNFKFSEIENEVNENFTYEERTELIENKHNNRKNLLQKEIEKLRSEKFEVENWNLKQIFNEIDINEYLNDFSNNGLLRNFILNGYINENYNDYISLFHEVSITKEDYAFERNVKGGYSTEFNYKLSDKIENLVEKIDEKYFERETILNFDLLDYLGNNYNSYSDKYDSVIRLLSNEKEKSIQFIDEYIKNEDRSIDVFIEKLVSNWRDFWEYIVEISIYDRSKIDQYLRIILTHAKVNTILSTQSHRLLDEIISTNPSFLSLVKNRTGLDYFEKISKLIKNLNIKFDSLENPNEETQKLFDFVYNNNLYKINKDNILQMLETFSEEDFVKDFERSNYSIVMKSECKPLIDYVNSDINVYVENVYLKLEKDTIEEESSLIHLLNNINLENILKVRIIQKIQTKISDLRDINDFVIKKELLLNNKFVIDWSNVIEYYILCEKVMTEDLINFLNHESVYDILSIEKLIKENKDFEVSLIKCRELSDESYKKLLSSCYYSWSSINFKNLNIEKVSILVDKILSFSTDNYNLLKEHFPNKHIMLAEKYFENFIKNFENFETDKEDILMILNSNKISLKNKWSYISLLDEVSIVSNNNISKIVGKIILQKNTSIDFEYITIESLIKNCSLIDDKLKLVTLYYKYLNNDQLIKGVSLIGWNYEEMFRKQHRPTVAINNDNTILLNILKTKQLIKRYEVDKKDKSLYRIIANY